MIYCVDVEYQNRIEHYTIWSDIGLEDATMFAEEVFGNKDYGGGKILKIYREIYSC